MQPLTAQRARTLMRLALLALAIALGSCVSAERTEARVGSEELALRQHRSAQQAAERIAGRRLWFAGFAMHSASNAFHGDVERVSSVFANLGGPALRYEFSNHPQFGGVRYPLATPALLAEALQRIAAQARSTDLVVLLISTHGTPKTLDVKVASTNHPPLTAAELARALQPLGDTPTVVVLSACYSGSFIPELARDTRIVLTAASAERSSWGCNFEFANTFFIEELFRRNFDDSLSLVQLVAQGHAQIAVREAAHRLRPSQPQMAIGAGVRWLAERPLKDWFAP